MQALDREGLARWALHRQAIYVADKQVNDCHSQLIAGSDNHQPIYQRYIQPIDAVPIALNPLDQEPTLLRRSTWSVACSKPIFNNHCAIMNMLLTGSDIHGPIYQRYIAYRCSAHRTLPSRSRAYRYIEPFDRSGAYRYISIRCSANRTKPSRSRAYITKPLHTESFLLKTNFPQLLCNNEYANNGE